MTVSYDTENHISVLTQLYGSVWRKVLPYCLLNVVLVIAVHYLMINDIIDLTFSDKGHSFMGIMVSFLLVARSNIAISSYSDCRALLGDAMRACRELIQHMIAFTRYDTSDSAKEWREDIARRTVAMLRTVVAVLEVRILIFEFSNIAIMMYCRCLEYANYYQTSTHCIYHV